MVLQACDRWDANISGKIYSEKKKEIVRARKQISNNSTLEAQRQPHARNSVIPKIR